LKHIKENTDLRKNCMNWYLNFIFGYYSCSLPITVNNWDLFTFGLQNKIKTCRVKTLDFARIKPLRSPVIPSFKWENSHPLACSKGRVQVAFRVASYSWGSWEWCLIPTGRGSLAASDSDSFHLTCPLTSRPPQGIPEEPPNPGNFPADETHLIWHLTLLMRTRWMTEGLQLQPNREGHMQSTGVQEGLACSGHAEGQGGCTETPNCLLLAAGVTLGFGKALRVFIYLYFCYCFFFFFFLRPATMNPLLCLDSCFGHFGWVDGTYVVSWDWLLALGVLCAVCSHHGAVSASVLHSFLLSNNRDSDVIVLFQLWDLVLMA
jgi:hypothetical protein